MTLVTQSEFARLHGVSRKTVTTWKVAGYLVFDGEKVDSEASDARLRGAKLGRFMGDPEITISVTSLPEGNRNRYPGPHNNFLRTRAEFSASVRNLSP